MRQTLNFTWVSGKVGRWCHLCRGYRAQLVQPNEAQSRGILRAQLHQQNDPRHDYFPVRCHLQRACDGKYNFIKHPAGCLLQILELLLTDVLRIGDHFKKFAFGIKFYNEFINVFDSIIVIVSYVMLILDLKLKILGLLRVLCLIKVIFSMKKVVDEKRVR